VLAGIVGACQSSAVAPRPPDAADVDATDERDVADATETTSPADGGTDMMTADGGWRSLLTAPSLPEWDRYLGEPSDGEQPLGLDDDPLGVYSVVTLDGEPAIHISGEIHGSLISKEEFCDFHLRLQYRWGTAVWPPSNGFDSGIMWLSTGPLGAVNGGGPDLASPAGSGAFMVSIEFQLTVGGAGAMYNLGPIGYQTTAPLAVTDNTPAAWKQVDIVFQGGTAQHLLDGQVIATGSGFELDWPGEPAMHLPCGKLQLQSEGAEIFFRRVEIQPLP
jgi:hypothetical protein